MEVDQLEGFCNNPSKRNGGSNRGGLGTMQFLPTKRGKATGGAGWVGDVRSSVLDLLIMRCALHQEEKLNK